jgi:predicted RNA binding protein YcfA (HicA-like mRNA interferase family)
MPKLRVLSAKEIIAVFEQHGFEIVSRKGSHIKLRREADGIRQTLTIPNHDELDRGTTAAIYRQASLFIPEIELRKSFYTGKW